MLKGCVFYYTMSSSIVEITFTQKMTRTPQPSPMSTLQPGIGVHKPKSPLFFAKFPKKSQQCKYYSTGLSRTPIQAVSKLVWTMSKTFKHIDFSGGPQMKMVASKNLTTLNIIHFYFVNDFDNM